MRFVSKVGLTALLGTALAAIAAPAAAADPGTTVTYRPASDRYCIRVTSDDDAIRTGLRLYRTECHSRKQWAALGLTIVRR